MFTSINSNRPPLRGAVNAVTLSDERMAGLIASRDRRYRPDQATQSCASSVRKDGMTAS